MKSWLGSFVSIALGSALLSHGALADRFDGVREAVRRHMQEKKVPGLAVAAWRDGKILWEEGFGWADVENRVAATEHTMFCLASVSKTLTAVGVMTLVEAGKVDLDRPANDYLGPDKMKSWIGDPNAATVRRLANHTAGLTGSSQFFYGEEARQLPSMSQTISRYGILVAPAGERYRYSNIGYGILGHLIAQVSGKSYGDYMRQDVFLPLGMTHSSLNLAPGLEKHQAVRYDFDRKPLPFYESAEPASASIYSSVHDLARFGLFFLNNRQADQAAILSARSIAQMTGQLVPQNAPVGSETAKSYGVGWMVSQEGGYEVIWHEGSTSGVGTALYLVPGKKAGVAILSNADGGASGLHSIVLKSLLPEWRERTPIDSAAPVPSAPSQPSAQLTGKWRGIVQTYEGEQPIQLQILGTGDVHIRVGGPPKFAGRSTLQQEALLNDVTFNNGALTGTSLASIATSDTQRHPSTLSLHLQLRGDVLNGYVSAESIYEGRWGYSLPYWAELRKQ
ncbi:serine hydrolase domain-containing protein [Peristeroidobacter soli]|uniref:serine hydrolase domain-containing protein n=1 Tax=Peristeroidobacter soli TaxID=2497877 RepID=UPI00101BA39B|nr:serine hydrolase domain-containing protein [Peristeroidobacter soli]